MKVLIRMVERSLWFEFGCASTVYEQYVLRDAPLISPTYVQKKFRISISSLEFWSTFYCFLDTQLLFCPLNKWNSYLFQCASMQIFLIVWIYLCVFFPFVYYVELTLYSYLVWYLRAFFLCNKTKYGLQIM